MKKIIFTIAAIYGLSSCSKKDDASPNNSLVGVWTQGITRLVIVFNDGTPTYDVTADYSSYNRKLQFTSTGQVMSLDGTSVGQPSTYTYQDSTLIATSLSSPTTSHRFIVRSLSAHRLILIDQPQGAVTANNIASNTRYVQYSR